MKFRILVLSILVLLIAVQVSDFILAPRTTMDVVKSKIATRLVARDLRTTFISEGREALDKRCLRSIYRLGYFFTCSTLESWRYSSDGRYSHLTDLYLSRHRTEHDARRVVEQHRREDALSRDQKVAMAWSAYVSDEPYPGFERLPGPAELKVIIVGRDSKPAPVHP